LEGEGALGYNLFEAGGEWTELEPLLTGGESVGYSSGKGPLPNKRGEKKREVKAFIFIRKPSHD